MVFSSITFLVFFALVLMITLMLQTAFLKKRLKENVIRRIKHIILLIASYIFYGWWDWRFCFLMFFMTLISYISAKNIENEKHIKLYKILGIAVPLVTLGFFKYFNFFIESFSTLFGLTNPGTLNIILPVGISFYTFQSMSYTIDVIQRRIKSHSLIDVALYVSFFPQLVAGPIVKAEDFIPQLAENKEINVENFICGIQIFVFGLFKKIVIADHLSVFVDDVFANPLIFSSASIILAVIAYSIQIYFDFSGYSDMAIGSAKCLGYDFKRNFNMPYISKNVSEFWKRWHISLSTWLREYLYIPLGGNRNGKVRTYMNLMITMILGGLWHGANVTFVLWGFLHGVALCVHKMYEACIKKPSHKKTVFATAASVLLTYVFVCICWVFFRAENISSALVMLNRVFLWQDGVMQPFTWVFVAGVLLAASEIAAYIKSKKKNEAVVNGFYAIMDLTKIGPLILFLVVVGLILGFAFTDENPFIYFQF